jgi:HSP20 family protein
MTFVKHNPNVANSILNDFFFNFPNTWGRDAQTQNFSTPPVNIHETAEGYHVELNVPGRNKEDFKINVDNGLLTIAFEKAEQTENKDYKTIKREFSIKSFKRSFTLDDKVNTDDIKAKYENGLLQLFVPKKEQVKVAAKEIAIV